MPNPAVSSTNGSRPDQGDPFAGERMQPHDEAAEQSVLGGMMLSRDAIDDVMQEMKPEDFYFPKHQAIFGAILTLYAAGNPTDPVAVSDELDRQQLLQKVGGAPYVHTCMATVPTAANASYYAEIVAKKAVLRRVIEAGTHIVQLGFTGVAGADVDELIDRAQARLHEATTRTRAREEAVTGEAAAASVLDFLDSDAPRDVVKSGLTDLDELTGGLARGTMGVVCARPGHGKSLLANAFNKDTAVDEGKHSLVFSMEMGRTALMQRMLASIPAGGIELDKLEKKKPMEPGDWDKLTNAYAQVAASQLFINDDKYQTTKTIASTARRHIQREGPLDLLTIDYGGLLNVTGNHERRDLAIASITRDLTILAGELDLSLLLLWQLNRNFAQRSDPRPQPQDLREGGSVEQDAHWIVGIFSPAVHNKDRSTKSELIVMKHRSGPVGSVEVAWQPQYGRFADLSKKQP